MSKEIKIGIFAVSILVVSFFLINYLRGEDIFNREIELSSRFASVEGLVPSAPVYIKGYKAGKVSEVIYDSEAEDFEVICSIKKEFRIPSDSKMTIYSVDIMGGKGVKIDLGTSGLAVSDGDALAPAFEAGLMDGLAGGIGPLMAKVTSTLDSLSVTVSGINRMLSEENSARIASTLAHLDRTMANVDALSAVIGGKSDELAAFVSNLQIVSDKLVSVAGQADTVLAGINTTVASISESDIAGVVTSLKDLLDNVNDPDGTIGKLFVDKSVYDSFDALLNDIDDLVNKIQENPKKYLKISVF
ncbi:MAG: MCE family protein [Bacteroidales bacterium]|nr:MCE family protein [Bacteroidales bacterium]